MFGQSEQRLSLIDEVAAHALSMVNHFPDGCMLALPELINMMQDFNTDLIIEMGYSWGSTLGKDKVRKILTPSKSNFDDLMSLCEVLGLNYTFEKGRQIQELMLKEGPRNKNDLDELIDKMQDSLKTELRARAILIVSNDQNSLYQSPEAGWDTVISVWPASAYDVQEAGRCLALDRSTAAVFHLSRIAEQGLREACAKYIPAANLPKPGKGTMGSYIATIDTFAKSTPMPTGAKELIEVAAHFDRIKNVWRNNVSHTGVEYTEAEARRCYDAIRDMLIICASIVSK